MNGKVDKINFDDFLLTSFVDLIYAGLGNTYFWRHRENLEE